MCPGQGKVRELFQMYGGNPVRERGKSIYKKEHKMGNEGDEGDGDKCSAEHLASPKPGTNKN